MIKLLIAATALSLAAGPASVQRIPADFASVGEDRRAIEALLATYTRAVSTKDQALFETLLLSRDIPFSGIGAALPADGNAAGLANYERFRKGVFEGRPFTQRFRQVRIEQDGALANVRLVFVNSAADGQSWGWKTLQLVKAGGRWKIASEFYTSHKQ
ncbi:MAG: nuclear transport factor 2 family protein [Sphingomonas sp.]